MVASLWGSEQNYQQDTHTTKARVVERNKDKLGRMNKTGKKVQTLLDGIYPSNNRKEKTLGKFKNLVSSRYFEVI